MFKIKLFNNISEVGTSKLNNQHFSLSEEDKDPHGMVLRSYKLPTEELSPSLLGIARAGAGVNNIPVEACTDQGIVVFNTPGANANAVKELVICGLFLSSRKIVQSINHINSLKDDTSVAKTAEKIKNQYAGPEIEGKTIGVIGLGAIGSKVANNAASLGMEVLGYDPFLTVDNAIHLTRRVQLAATLDNLLERADYLSLHLPLNDKTKDFVNTQLINKMKPGMRIMNFSRGEIVSNQDIVQGIKEEKIAGYVTDFASPELLNQENIIVMPHLGASTPEAEDNCAAMACTQLGDFLQNGNIKNSVNFPNVIMPRDSKTRITIMNKNIPSIVEKISGALSENNINIHEMINKSCGNVAYNIIDTDQDVSNETIEKINGIEGIIRVRKIV